MKKSTSGSATFSATLNVKMTERKDEFDHFNWNILQQVTNRSISPEERQKFAQIYGSNHLESIDKFGNSEPDEFLSESDLIQLVENHRMMNPTQYPEFDQPNRGMINIHRDTLLHFPYDSFDRMLNAIGKEVRRIKQITISVYRLADNSDVIKLLTALKCRGVEVDVLIEPNARGNEKQNIILAHQLKTMGMNVIIGESSKKIHAKFIHIRWKDDSMTSIIMTGNFNENTARLYEDYALITSDPSITYRMWKMIYQLPHGFKDVQCQDTLVCFTKLNAVSTLIKYIKREIEKGSRGYILIKCNSLTDPTFICILEYAAQQGVIVEIICRGECCWKPVSENAHIHRFIHKYLEHSRVYCFGRMNPTIYIGSLDLATHKLFERFELICQIQDKDHIQRIQDCMRRMLFDISERHYDLYTDGNRHWYKMRG